MNDLISKLKEKLPKDEKLFIIVGVVAVIVLLVVFGD